MRCFFLRVLFLLLVSAPILTAAQDVQTYTVKPGDTLFSIARAHNISVDDLRRYNKLESGPIRSGMTLIVSEEKNSASDVIPLENDKDTENAVDLVEMSRSKRTLPSIADELGMSVEELLRISPEIQQAIDRLNQITPVAEKTTESYVVKAGETLFSIARTYGMTVRQLSDLNSMTQTSIRAGQKLQVPGNQPAGTTVWALSGEINAVMYPSTFVGRMMASEVVYDDVMLIVSHATLPIGTLVMLGKVQEGPTVLCIVGDESLSVSMNVIDVSEAVADAIGLAENERIEVYTLK